MTKKEKESLSDALRQNLLKRKKAVKSRKNKENNDNLHKNQKDSCQTP